jgi:1-acyl-sn-glycerol-3-phosphate acyltransferase
VPAGLAGTFQAWPRRRLLPRPHPIRIVYGRAIAPEQLDGLSPPDVTSLIRERLDACHREALHGLARDLGRGPMPDN